MRHGRTFKSTIVIVFVVAFGFALTSAGAERKVLPRRLPVSSMRGNPEDRHRVTGLTFTVEDAGWPTLSMLGDPNGLMGSLRGSTLKGGHLKPIPVSFGCVTVGTEGRLTEQSVNEVSNTLTFTGEAEDVLKVTVTRLSPAILLESDSSQIELFAHEERPLHQAPPDTCPPSAGAVKPLRWATPGPDGQVRTGVLGRQAVGELSMKGWEERYARAKSLATPQPAQPPLDRLSNTWLLLWYGSDSPFLSSKAPYAILRGPTYPGYPHSKSVFQADVPFLLVLEHAPASIRLVKEGGSLRLMMGFPEDLGKAAMLPLYGHDLLPAAETEKWLADFPAAVRERCDAWARSLSQFPVDVKESVVYDAAGDRVTVTEEFQFVTVRPGAERMAPVPAMLALGCRQGLAVQFSSEPVDMRMATQFGPMMAVAGESYTWSLEGPGSYVRERRAIGPSNLGAQELERELVREVDKVLEAGHLAPWKFSARKGGFAVLSDPSETLMYLSEIVPVLPPDRQTKLRAYLKTEYANYPPDKVLALDWQEGVQRDPRWDGKAVSAYGAWLPGTRSDAPYEAKPSLHRAYGVQRCIEVLGGKPTEEILGFWRSALHESLEGRQWDTLGWFWGKHGPIRGMHSTFDSKDFLEATRRKYFEQTLRCAHRDMAGIIGYIRLCEMAGLPAEPEAWGQLARLAALRFCLARYGQYMATSGLFRMPTDRDVVAVMSRSGDFSRPESHLEQVMTVSQHGVILPYGVNKERAGYMGRTFNYGFKPYNHVTFMDMVPEVARLMVDLGLKNDVGRFLQRFEEVQANWYTSLSDLAFIGGEDPFMMPTCSHQLFMAHAWIAGTPPGRLARYIDVPWAPLGDLYYMHKLAETIKAYRGVKWVSAERGGGQ